MNIRELFSSGGFVGLSLNWDKVLEENGVTLLKAFLVAKKGEEEGILDYPQTRMLISEGGLVHGTVVVEADIVATVVVCSVPIGQAMLGTATLMAFYAHAQNVLEGTGEEDSEEFIRRVEEFLDIQAGGKNEAD